MKNYNGDQHINVGSGFELDIKSLSIKIRDLIGYSGRISFQNINADDGTPRKLLDSSKINQLGWFATQDFDNGLKKTYDWFLKNIAKKL